MSFDGLSFSNCFNHISQINSTKVSKIFDISKFFGNYF
nr:MAG TPA: hypothetical protein [Crassvirales sp.]